MIYYITQRKVYKQYLLMRREVQYETLRLDFTQRVGITDSFWGIP